MDLIDELQSIASNIERRYDDNLTEEATKTAFVMPFIKALGYDIFNPSEVIPEYTADYGVKKGEKVDYAISKDGENVILFECKRLGNNLNGAPSQLYRYFSVEDAKIGIVTDGRVYHFYTDLEKTNQMDDKPYMEIDLLNIDESLIPQLKRLTKSSFDLDTALATANELKYTKEIRRKIGGLVEDPTSDFVKFFASLVYDGRFTQKAQEQFKPIVKKAFNQFIREQINSKLDTAFVETEEEVESDEEQIKEGDFKPGIVTTDEEIEGYHIVKSLVRDVVEPERVYHRDTKSYMGILLDDNNRQPICRLRFNTSQKYLGVFDENKNEEKIIIDSLNDIYEYADELRFAAQNYD